MSETVPRLSYLLNANPLCVNDRLNSGNVIGEYSHQMVGVRLGHSQGGAVIYMNGEFERWAFESAYIHLLAPF